MTQQKKIVAKECRFAIHIPTRSSDAPDLHLVKEVRHYEDGTHEPFTNFVKNYKRPFAVTKEAYRNHEQKKESESLDRLNTHHCTQSDLRFHVARALGKGWSNAQMRELSKSPFLYGTDVSSTVHIKSEYRKRWPDVATDYTVAYYDIETDMTSEEGDPIMTTLVFEDLIHTTILSSFFRGYSNVVERILEMLEKQLKIELPEKKYRFKIELVDSMKDLIKKPIDTAHEKQPDFIAIWNIDFDLPKVIGALERQKVDIKDVFCHPGLPPHMRFCKYKKGKTKKVTASGQVKPMNPSEQWHSLLVPASFYFICAMSSYRFIRQGAPEEPDYKLDSILEKEKIGGKLKMGVADEFEGGDWHYVMQTRFKFEYVIYHIFDCIRMQQLNDKTGDLTTALPVRAGCSDFAKFNSQTKRLSDKYSIYLESRGHVIGVVEPKDDNKDVASADEVLDVEDESDYSPNVEASDADEPDPYEHLNEVLSLRNWIITLPSHQTVLGLPLIKEYKGIRTQIRGLTYDSDAVSAYPSCTAAGNVSKATCSKEIITIDGVEENDFRRHNLNILQGHVNALEYGCEMFKLPKPREILSYFEDM